MRNHPWGIAFALAITLICLSTGSPSNETSIQSVDGPWFGPSA